MVQKVKLSSCPLDVTVYDIEIHDLEVHDFENFQELS